LSEVASIIVQSFLPDHRKRYVQLNLKQSGDCRAYDSTVPPYLHNRPRHTILHCLKRKEEGEKLPRSNVTCIDAHAGKFRVKGSRETVYDVSFGSSVEMPSCSCPDFTKHHLPCKHFFAVFQFDDSWNWASLPTLYLSSPYMSIDWIAIRCYFSGKDSEIIDGQDDPGEWSSSLEGEAMGGEELHAQEGDLMHRQEESLLEGQGEWLEVEGEAVDRQEDGQIHGLDTESIGEEDMRQEVEHNVTDQESKLDKRLDCDTVSKSVVHSNNVVLAKLMKQLPTIVPYVVLLTASTLQN